MAMLRYLIILFFIPLSASAAELSFSAAREGAQPIVYKVTISESDFDRMMAAYAAKSFPLGFLVRPSQSAGTPAVFRAPTEEEIVNAIGQNLTIEIKGAVERFFHQKAVDEAHSSVPSFEVAPK